MGQSSRTNTFVLAGLLVAFIIAAALSPFASSFPDGLEKVAEKQGFLKKGEGSQAWKLSPIPDYLMPGLGEGAAATAVAGLAGTGTVFLLGYGLAFIVRKRSRGAGLVSEEESETAKNPGKEVTKG